jgi:hypothetical protein
MGIGMFAMRETIPDEELYNAFASAGLDSNFRHCDVKYWKSVVEVCLDLEEFGEVEWNTYTPDTIADWLQLAKERAQIVEGLGLDPFKFIKYLEVCLEQNANILVY